jgi:hypothetical protein
MEAAAVVIERITIAERQRAVDRKRGLPGLFQAAALLHESVVGDEKWTV